jgi:radical SAM family uncharacterized protein
MYDGILLNVKRPGQYLGREWNVSAKDFESAQVKFAVSFPDLYEIGMSNLGLRIIYGLLNSLPAVSCERFFSVDADLEALLRAQGSWLLSLESRRRLEEFDFAGFSLGSELNYTNVLNILDLSGIPLKSSERGNKYPLVIGGGPSAMNPEPMHEFFDLFIIGEAEEAILEVIDLYRRHKDAYRGGGIKKEELLLSLSGIEGVYVPSLYEVEYDSQGNLKEFKPKFRGVPDRIRKRVVGNLNSSYYPQDWVVPNVQVVHDRVTLEIMRGCPNRCRFCQARSQYFPLRLRDPSKAIMLAQEMYRLSGYEEVALSGLSVSDYPFIEGLLQGLCASFTPKGVGLSLPSLKAKTLIGGVSQLIAKFKKTSLTFAPEAGSERLRQLLAKDFDSAQFFSALNQAYAAGYQHVKLYFMIGLPQETEEDLKAIVDFSTEASRMKKEAVGSSAQVNISINNLIPKPHTALQWLPMLSMEEAERKQAFINESARKNRRLKVNFHNFKMSFLEGILSRGDRRLSGVILSSFKRGAKFDAWSNYFNLQLWLDSFRECGLDPEFYLRPKPVEIPLPWDFIDTGISKAALLEEFNKTIAI